MKVSDFKLLSTLPEKYDYRIWESNNSILIMGINKNEVIGYRFENAELKQIYFEYQKDIEQEKEKCE